MHAVQLDDSLYEKLKQQAAAAGFADVAAFIEVLADAAAFDATCGLSDAELRQSAAECARINQQMKAGAGRDAQKALQELGQELGYDSFS